MLCHSATTFAKKFKNTNLSICAPLMASRETKHRNNVASACVRMCSLTITWQVDRTPPLSMSQFDFETIYKLISLIKDLPSFLLKP